jgi:hypothetical protein
VAFTTTTREKSMRSCAIASNVTDLTAVAARHREHQSVDLR